MNLTRIVLTQTLFMLVLIYVLFPRPNAPIWYSRARFFDRFAEIAPAHFHVEEVEELLKRGLKDDYRPGMARGSTFINHLPNATMWNWGRKHGAQSLLDIIEAQPSTETVELLVQWDTKFGTTSMNAAMQAHLAPDELRHFLAADHPPDNATLALLAALEPPDVT